MESALTRQVSRRITHKLMRDWCFTYRPEGESWCGFEQPSTDDRLWRPIALPHTWHTWETTGQVHPFIRDPSELDDPFWWTGRGFYRKRVRLSDKLADRRVFLEFDGVQKCCRVFVNGQLCGNHIGGFTSFHVDITRAVRFGQENLIAVEVDARRDDPGCTPPMTAGNWNPYGGIYREVRIVLKDPLHIPFQGSADHEGGVFITTPMVSRDAASVRIRAWVRNESLHAMPFQMVHRLIDPQGEVCHTLVAQERVEPGASVEVEQVGELPVRPQLWSPQSPAMYHCKTELYQEGELVDHVTSPLGFRWFHWDYEQRQLYLNGQPVHLHGTNRHQEYPWLGDAVPAWVHRQEMHEIRHTLGHNFIRTCHYPQATEIYDLCDRLGLLCCEEVPNIKNLPFDAGAQRRMVREMIRRDRNHPSIIMWSVGNETDHAADGNWVREEDPTRLVHARHVYAGAAVDEPHNHTQIDMENLLRCTVRGWTAGDRFPTEDDLSGQVTGTEVYQHRQACIDNGSKRGRIDRDTVAWLYADHGADREYRRCPLKHVNPKGWVDMYREPKYIYHLWQAHYADQLTVFIQGHDWRKHHIGRPVDVRVDSNGQSVELLVNDRSFGVKHPAAESFFSVCFERVPVEAGDLKAIARRGTETATHIVPMAGEPERLRLSTSHTILPADRSGIALVRVEAVDAQGHIVPEAHPDLKWLIEGPGKLLAPSEAKSQINECEADEGTMYITLPIRMPVRSTRTPGMIRVRCEAAGLQPDEIHIQSCAIDKASADGIVEPAMFDPDHDELAAYWARPRPVRSEHHQVIYEDVQLASNLDEPYRMQLDRLVRSQFPAFAPQTERYAQLLDELSQLAERGRGTVIADDFNSALAKFRRNDAVESR